MDYLTAKQTIGKLKQGRVTDISEAYFSQLVSMGAIPFHMIPGKKRKLYLYDEVKKALANSRDPSRDAQREVHQVNREAKADETIKEAINDRYQDAKKTLSFSVEEFAKGKSLSEKVLMEIRKDAEEAIAWNEPLMLLLDTQKQSLQTLELDSVAKDIVMIKILKLTIDTMTTLEDLLGFIDEVIEEHEDGGV